MTAIVEPVEYTPVEGRPPLSAEEERAIARRSRRGRLDVKLSPYIYIAPFFLLFALTGLFPLLFTAYIATRQWNTLTGDGGIAICGATCDNGNVASIFGNFQWVLHQPVFWIALRNSFSIFLLSTVPQLIIALILAAILDANLKAKTFWRMGVLLPYVIAPSAAGIIFAQIFSDQQGLINTLLNWIGIQPIHWHASTFWSHIAIATIVNYRWVGYNTLILLAAMQAIPRDVYEASVVDGASRMRQFFSVTIPLLRPTLIFVTLTSVIGGLQIFDEVQMFSEAANYGGSNNQFMTVSLLLWRTGFLQTTPGQPNMGRAAAIAWLLFLIVVALAILNYLLTSRIASSESGSTKKKRKRANKLAKQELMAEEYAA